MSLPELCLTRNMLPKRLLGRRLPSLQNEGILVKKQPRGGRGEEMHLFMNALYRGDIVPGAVNPERIKPSLSLNDTRLQGTLGKKMARGV